MGRAAVRRVGLRVERRPPLWSVRCQHKLEVCNVEVKLMTTNEHGNGVLTSETDLVVIMYELSDILLHVLRETATRMVHV